MGERVDAAIAEGRAVFQQMVIDPPDAPLEQQSLGVALRVLKSAKGNIKIGARMTKGPWAGMPILSLTLEERKTCPRSCDNWGRCYGDNMHMAKRHRHGMRLESALAADLDALDARFPDGYVVRLHVLGDFYSREYVWFWYQALADRPALRIYGYTHWQMGTEIGDEVTYLALDWRGRVSILRSDRKSLDDPLPGAYTVPSDGEAHAGSVICPVEDGRQKSCGACGLCMLGRISVSFRDHGREVTLERNMAARRARALPVVQN